MEKSTKRTAEKRMEDPAGNLAVTLLAYNDMDRTQDVERLLLESDRATLGRAMALWFQMCAQERGKTATGKAARIVAQNLQNRLEGLDKSLPYDEYKTQGLPLSYGRGLLLLLAEAGEERFTELWMKISTEERVAVETASILMGFTLSVLRTSEPDCE